MLFVDFSLAFNKLTRTADWKTKISGLEYNTLQHLQNRLQTVWIGRHTSYTLGLNIIAP